MIYVQDAFIVQKGHMKCTVAQKKKSLTPIFIFNEALCADIKNILYKKSLC